MIVTLLTGRRPLLLARTLESLRQYHPEILENFTLVLHNGGDRPTAEVLEQHRDVLDLIVTSEFLDIGPAVSLLFRHALEVGEEHLLHLEDDWEATDADPFLSVAEAMLDDVFQVRLRWWRETTLPTHMVTGRRINWTGRPGNRITNDAHYTLNPSLIRLADVPKGFPATSEQDAQRRFWEAGCRKVAQLPGTWKHIGTDSLRRRVAASV